MAQIGGLPPGQFNALPSGEQADAMQGNRPPPMPPALSNVPHSVGPPHVVAPVPPRVGPPAPPMPPVVPAMPAPPAAAAYAPSPVSQPTGVPQAHQILQQAASQIQNLTRIAPLVSPAFAHMFATLDKSNPVAAWQQMSHAFTVAAQHAGYQDPAQYVKALHDRADYNSGRAHAAIVMAQRARQGREVR